MKLNKLMFREYDIRGIYGTDIDEEVSYHIGRAYATRLLSLGKNKMIVGYDNRASSTIIEENLVKGLTEGGVDVVRLGLVTTPMYYYAWDKLNIKCGIMITASHNPKEYNGFKIAFDSFGNACGQMIQDFRVYTENGNFKTGDGKITNYDIKQEYLDEVKKSIDMGEKKIKVVLDTANGTASIIAKQVYSMFDNIELIPLYIDSNPDFPNHHPDPSVESNNEDLKKKVLETHADVGIGIDGDGDRVGIIDEKGNMIFMDFYAIIIWRDIMDKVENKKALFDVKCSKSLADEVIKLGGTPVCYRTGNSYMKAKMRDDDFPFGSELSGHVWFRDKWDNIDDGLYAGLRLVEILSKTDKTVSQLLDGVTRYYASPEIIIKSSDDVKFKVIEKVKEYCKQKGYKVNDIDGVRAEFSNGWALVRASNTGPNITARFEGVTPEDEKAIEEEFMALI